MKCQCGIEGHLQMRGNSYRVQHYMGFNGAKRCYQYHKIDKSFVEDLEVNGSNGSKIVEVKPANSNSFSEKWSLGRDLDPRPPPYQGDAPPG